MTPEVRRLVLAVLAYDRALARTTRQHVKMGRLGKVKGDSAQQVFISAKKLDSLYLDMLRALAPLLVEAGLPLPKEWPPELRQ